VSLITYDSMSILCKCVACYHPTSLHRYREPE